MKPSALHLPSVVLLTVDPSSYFLFPTCSIISDLVRVAIAGEKAKRKAAAKAAVASKVTDRLLSALAGEGESKETFREALESGELEDVEVEIDVPQRSSDESDFSDSRTGLAAHKLQSLFSMMETGGGRSEKRTLRIRDARPLLEDAEMDALVSSEDVTADALRAAADDGIVFIDEIDKIASAAHSHKGPDASSEGVQRDLLPLIEGTTVSTKHGDVSTDHILFICSGAFHSVKPSDLLAELQGRLPIRVELAALTEDDLYRVLASTEHSLVKQQTALLKVDKCNVTWTDEALREIAKGQTTPARSLSSAACSPPLHFIFSLLFLLFLCVRSVSASMNRSIENIGARRLNTVIEKILDDVSYDAADSEQETNITIDAEMVRNKVADINKAADLGKFIL